MKTSKILFLAGCTLIATSLNAQTTKKKSTAAPKDTLIQRDLVMEKEYEPTVGPAEKLSSSPDLEVIKVEKQPLAFSITESPTTVHGDYNPLPAAGIDIPFPASNQFGFIRLGVGSRRSFLGDAQINLLRQTNQALDVNFMHRSVFGDILNSNEELVRAYTNKNFLRSSYKLHLENTEIDAHLSEKYNAWNYYGTWRTSALPVGSLIPPSGQWSSDSEFGFNIKSKDMGQPFSYKLYAEGHLFRLGNGFESSATTDSKAGREKEFSLKGALNYDINELFHLGLDAQMRNFTYRAPVSLALNGSNLSDIDAAFTNRRWFEFTPYGRMTYKRWLLTAGLKLSIPSLQNELVKPNIVASASTALSEKASFKVKLDGGVQPFSYREGLEMNPYLDPSVRLKSAWKVIDVSGQIDYRPSTRLRLSPAAGYDVTKDMPAFFNAYPLAKGVNDYYGNLFDVQYMNSNRFWIGMNGLYSFRSYLTIQGEVYYNKYVNFSSDNSVDNLLKENGRKAWNRPGLQTRLRADFTPIDELNLFIDYKVEAMRYTATRTNFSEVMNSINDLSLGANFKLTKDVGVFLHVNNLLDQRYEVWNGYAVHGFAAMIGGSVKF